MAAFGDASGHRENCGENAEKIIFAMMVGTLCEGEAFFGTRKFTEKTRKHTEFLCACGVVPPIFSGPGLKDTKILIFIYPGFEKLDLGCYLIVNRYNYIDT